MAQTPWWQSATDTVKRKTNCSFVLAKFKLHFGFVNFLSNNCNSIVCISQGGETVCLPPQPPPPSFLSTASLKSLFAFGCKCTRRFIWTFPLLSSDSAGLSQPYRIDIFEDYIYGTGLKNEVFKIHKFGKQTVEFLNSGVERPTNIFISSRYKQQDGKKLKFLDYFYTLLLFTFCRRKNKGGRVMVWACFRTTVLHFIEGNCCWQWQ